jgi:Acyl-coenzyme A synthetases/AMP-(fatty) acid ligases
MGDSMADKQPEASLDALLNENRTFHPSGEFRRNASAADESVYDVKDREAFWERWAKELDWQTPWKKVLDWNPPDAQWFVGGKLNASANCLDRHLATRGDKKAIIWEGSRARFAPSPTASSMLKSPALPTH